MIAVAVGLVLEGLTIGAAFAAIILLGLFACVPLHGPAAFSDEHAEIGEQDAALHGCTTPPCRGDDCGGRAYATCFTASSTTSGGGGPALH